MTSPATQLTQTTPTTLDSIKSYVPQGLVTVDKLLDFIPFGSAANNLIDLGIKHLVIKDMDPESSEMKVYIEHLKKKQTSECLIYSIPFLGNLAKLGKVTYDAVLEKKEEPVPEVYGLPPARDEYVSNDYGFSTIGHRLKKEDGLLHTVYEGAVHQQQAVHL